MEGSCINFGNPIKEAVSKIRFAPQSNNLLISSWDSSLRLYDVDSSQLRFESSSEAALLDCCFGDETDAFSAGADGSISRYDLQAGTSGTIGSHDDIATCIQYSDETCQVVTAGLDRKIRFWDTRQANSLIFVRNTDTEVGSIALSKFDLAVSTGASVNMYDLRSLEKPVQPSESQVNVQIRSISLVPYSIGYAVGSVDGRVALNIPGTSNSGKKCMFRCHPTAKKGRYQLTSVNAIEFIPLAVGVIVTGDNDGYVSAWNTQKIRRLFELPKYGNSVASLSLNCDGQLLAVASSCTYQEAIEIEEPPQIFIHKFDRLLSFGSPSMK